MLLANELRDRPLLPPCLENSVDSVLDSIVLSKHVPGPQMQCCDSPGRAMKTFGLRAMGNVAGTFVAWKR